VIEILPDNQVESYPYVAMNSWKEGDDGKNKWVCVQAVYVDEENCLWVVAPACLNTIPLQKNMQLRLRCT